MTRRSRWYLFVAGALLGAAYCVLGVLMSGSFSAAAPDHPQHAVAARLWAAGGAVGLLLAALAAYRARHARQQTR